MARNRWGDVGGVWGFAGDLWGVGRQNGAVEGLARREAGEHTREVCKGERARADGRGIAGGGVGGSMDQEGDKSGLISGASTEDSDEGDEVSFDGDSF